ncbi:MAG: hypothetical protein ICV77_12010, partial [Cyanobacteria bacterium Co-bin8]|nr:hypothetical protein [Cyanobacteria bacterium Co-bin8]
PRYGVAQSEITRSKIAEKAKARLQDPEYRKRWEEARSRSEKVQQQTERLKQYNLQRYRQVFVICQYCGQEFEALYRKSNPPQYCSRRCSVSFVRGKTSPKSSEGIQELALAFARANSEDIISCKLNAIKPVLKPFYEKVYRQYGIQDERTLSKALLGVQASRKEILYYFRSLVENVLGTTGN